MLIQPLNGPDTSFEHFINNRRMTLITKAANDAKIRMNSILLNLNVKYVFVLMPFLFAYIAMINMTSDMTNTAASIE